MYFNFLADTVTQSPIDPLGGWTAIILQAGAFGLLTYVVVYLAPKALRDATAEREARDKMFNDLVMALQTKFEARNDKMIDSINQQTRVLQDAMGRICQGGIPQRKG